MDAATRKAIDTTSMYTPEELFPSGNMIVYSICPTKSLVASQYYRQYVPLDAMEKQGLPVTPILDAYEASTPLEKRAYAMSYSDINLFYQPMGTGLLRQMEMVKTWKPQRQSNGEWRWPPSWIFDTDDNMFNVHPTNLTFKRYGIRGIDGTPLKPGDTIRIKHDNKQPEDVLWADGKNINITDNLRRMDEYLQIMRNASAITCSTRAVEEYVREEISPDIPTYIFPNSVNFSDYPQVELAEHPDEVRILWPGSATHYEDWFYLKDALTSVLKKHPNAKLILWGMAYKNLTDALPAGQWKEEAWVPYSEFKLRLSCMNHDITVAPLNPHVFNRCRSGIKMYESAAISKPAPCLAQRGPAYEDIKDGENGMLFVTPEEFATKLSALIENAALRKTIAANAKAWVREHRDAAKEAKKLYEFYVKTRVRARKDQPPRPEPVPFSNKRPVRKVRTQVRKMRPLVTVPDLPHLTLKQATETARQVIHMRKKTRKKKG